jgi:FtsP/CotA-like multicopper oxidase with cupredoxin domain
MVSQIQFTLILAQIRVSIDQHVLKVVEVDDMPIQPIFLHELQIDPGQRYSVIVNMNQAGSE